jgi:hypothetical protein
MINVCGSGYSYSTATPTPGAARKDLVKGCYTLQRILSAAQLQEKETFLEIDENKESDC